MLEFAEGLGIRCGPWDSLKALGFIVKCHCSVLGFTACMTSHDE